MPDNFHAVSASGVFMTRKVAVWLCIVVMLGAGIYCFADEGMWLFNAFPKDKVQAQYGFAP